MSTPQTLHQAPAPHYNLDYRQRHLISPNQRYLPPPRPASNVSNSGYYQNLPARPSSNLSTTQQFAAPPRTQSGMSNGYTHHPQVQARGGAQEHAYANGVSQQSSNEDLRRTGSRASQHQRAYQEPVTSRVLPPSTASAAQMPMTTQQYQQARAESAERSRRKRHQRDVDWVEYFGGKPPTEIITIHDDDSPAPTAPPPAAAPRPLPTTNGASSTGHHVDKRRRVNGVAAEQAHYSETRTPYSYSNGNSTESLQATTAPTSHGSQVSSSSRLDSTQTGQKRKRTTRTSEQERKKQEVERSGPRGYLAEYGEYIPPPKQHKKQREVHVPILHDVRLSTKTGTSKKHTDKQGHQRYKTNDKVDDEDGHYIVQENSMIGDRYSLVNLLGQGTFGKVVRARDRTKNREVAVKIIRAVPKVLLHTLLRLRYPGLTKLLSIVTHHASSCVSCRHCETPTVPTATAAYS